MTPETLLQRHQRMLNRRQLYESQLQQCAQYVRPLRSVIGFSQTEGNISTSEVYDSSAIVANRLLGSRLAGTMCSQAIRWHGLKVRDNRLNERREVRTWFNDATDALLLAYGQSLFYSEVTEAMTDLPGLGTGGLFTEEAPLIQPGFNGLVVRACGIGEIVIDEGPTGLVDVVGRVFTLPGWAAKAKWPTGLSEKTLEGIAAKTEEVVEFLHFVCPRPEGRSPKIDAEGMLEAMPSTQLPWASYYIETKAKTMVEEGGYHEMPYAIGRWSRPSNELYGRGIGHDALPDVKAANVRSEMFEAQWRLAVNPPYKAKRNVQVVRLTPGGRTEVRDKDDLSEWITQARFDVAQAGIADLRKSIRDMWFDEQLQLRESSRMTTVEVYARLELMQQLLGPNVGRATFEVLNRFIERAFGLLLRAKAFPPLPPALLEYVRGQGMWDIEYQSPLARSQRAPELQAIDRTISAVGGMQAIYPDVKDVVDADEAIRTIGDVSGTPPKIIRDAKDVAIIRQARMEAQNQAAQLDQANVIADSLGKASGMVKALQPQGGGV